MRDKVSGIYLIKNVVNERAYVGRSIDITERFAGHIGQMISGNHPNKHLLDDFNSFGISNFDFRILEVVDYSVPDVNSYLAGLEEKYALRYNAAYPNGYCKLIGDLQSSDDRLLTEKIICLDVRTGEEKYAESFGEAAAMTRIKAGMVKKVIGSSSSYKNHHLFFFESDYREMDPAVLEKKKTAAIRYSNQALQIIKNSQT